MIKVEMKPEDPNDPKNTVVFAFECNSPDDHATLDLLRTVILGDHLRRGGNINSNRVVIEFIKPDEIKLS